MLLEFQFLRLRANFGVYFMLEAYSKFVLGRKNAGKFIREGRNQNSDSAKIFRRNGMTLQHRVSVVMT